MNSADESELPIQKPECITKAVSIYSKYQKYIILSSICHTILLQLRKPKLSDQSKPKNYILVFVEAFSKNPKSFYDYQHFDASGLRCTPLRN